MAEEKTPEELVEEGLAALGEEEQEEREEEEEEVVEAPQYTEAEEEAIRKGWNPEGVEGKRNLSAQEFLDREEFYSQIHSLKRENKKLSEDIKNLSTYQKRVRADERKRVMSELKAAKKLALEAEDYDKVVEIDDEILKAREEVDDTPTPTDTTVIQEEANRAFQEWLPNNKWYSTDREMREYADRIGAGLFQEDPNRSPSDLFTAVEREVKARYKEKFAPASAKPRASAVEGSSRGKPKNSSTLSEKNLSEEERSIMKTVLRTTPGMTKEEYLKELTALS